MATFEITNNSGEVIGKANSVKKALEIIENSFQCGTKETRSEVCAVIRSIGSAIVEHKIIDNRFCFIKEV
jgi:hypothetical protein